MKTYLSLKNDTAEIRLIYKDEQWLKSVGHFCDFVLRPTNDFDINTTKFCDKTMDSLNLIK
ncbi:MAG: hypothetical protein V4580_04915 [Bacteroidota bacterium]